MLLDCKGSNAISGVLQMTTGGQQRAWAESLLPQNATVEEEMFIRKRKKEKKRDKR